MPKTVLLLIALLAACGPRPRPAAPPAPAPALEAHCCTSPCWPGGVLGSGCTEPAMTRRLREKAYRAGARDVRDVACKVTDEVCNATCESTPGSVLVCRGLEVR